MKRFVEGENRQQSATNREMLTVIADRGYFKGEEILACEETGMTPLVPKPLTSGAKAEGRFGKQNFIYSAAEDEYRCPAGQRLTWRFNNVEHGLTLRHYWTGACVLDQASVHDRQRTPYQALGA